MVDEQCQLVFEGLEDSSPETLQRVKATCIVDLEFTISQTQEMLEHPPFVLRNAATAAELNDLYQALKRAGARVLIVQPSSPPVLQEEIGEEPAPEEESFTIELEQILEEEKPKREPKTFSLPDLDEGPRELSDEEGLSVESEELSVESSELPIESEELSAEPDSASGPMPREPQVESPVPPATELSFDDLSEVEPPPIPTITAASSQPVSDIAQTPSIAAIASTASTEKTIPATKMEFDSGSDLQSLVDSVRGGPDAAPVTESVTSGLTFDLGPAPAELPLTHSSNRIVEDVSLTIAPLTDEAPVVEPLASAPPPPVKATPVAEKPPTEKKAPPVVKTEPASSESRNPLLTPQKLFEQPAAASEPDDEDVLPDRRIMRASEKKSDSSFTRGQLVGLFAMGVLALGGLNFLAGTQTPAPLPLSEEQLQALEDAKLQATPDALIPVKTKEAVPTLRGVIETPALTLALIVESSDKKKMFLQLRGSTPEPPPLTPEQIGRKEIREPWLKRVEANQFVVTFDELKGAFVGNGTAYAFVEYNGKRHRLPLTTHIEIVNKEGGQEGSGSLELVYLPTGETELPAGKFVEAIGTGKFRVGISEEMKLKLQ